MLLCFVQQAFRWDEFEHADPGQVPAMRGCRGPQFLFGFGERDVECRLIGALSLDEELHRQRGLAGAGIALDEVEPVAFDPAIQDIIQAFDAQASLRGLKPFEFGH